MIGLIKVEVRRLLSRRLFRALTALVVAGFTLASVLTFINSDNSSEAVAAADEQRRLMVQQCVANPHAWGAPTGGRLRDPAEVRAFCEEEVWVADPGMTYTEVEWILMSMGIPLIMLTWLLGASFIGAESTNRTLTSALTWEPRRIRLIGAKAIALVVIAFLWIVALQGLLAAGLYPAAYFRGSLDGVDGAFWGDLSAVAGRVGLAGMVASLMGFSLATAGKSTAAALGIGFAQLALVEGLIRAFKPSWSDWLIGDNLSLFLVGAEDVNHLGHSQIAAGGVLVAYAAALLIAALVVFERREMS